MDDDIEKQYSPSVWSHRFEPAKAEENYFTVLIQNSERAKLSIPCELGISYGNSDAQKVDMFGSKDLPEDAPIFAFVHGGYWIAGRREDSSHFVKPFYDAGVVCAVLGYDLISETVTLPYVIDEIIEGIHFILKFAAERKSKGLYISGHSAGGHLIMMALSTGNFNENEITLMKGVIPISGLYDLNPLLKHSISRDARLTKEIVNSSSPINVIDKTVKILSSTSRILIAVAEHDSPAFRMQSQKYEESLQSAGIKSEFLMVEDEDHFSVIEKLMESDYNLTKIIIKMIHGS